MKRYLVLTVVVLVVLAVAWTAFGQEQAQTGSRGDRRLFRMLSPEKAAEMRAKWESMSEEEKEKFRAEMREKWENMSDEEKEALRARRRERSGGRGRGLSAEEQKKAIAEIEKQLAKLKEGIESTSRENRPNFREMSAEKRTELRQQWMKAREERRTTINAIIAELGKLQGQTAPAGGGEMVIVSAGELKEIHALAVKEKAEETAQRLERIGRGPRGFGGGRQGQGLRPAMPGVPEGPRGPRGPRGADSPSPPPGDQED